MQLLVVIPIADPRFTPIVRDEIRTLIGSSQHRVVVEHLATGPRWIDSPQAEAEAGAAIVRAYRDLSRSRYDAVFVTCFGEPGVDELAAAIDVPVIGGRRPALAEAVATGAAVTVVLPNRELAHHVSPQLPIDARIAWLDAAGTSEATRIIACIENAIAGDPRPHAVVLGCTAWTRRAEEVQRALPTVQVIEPQAAAVRRLLHLGRTERMRMISRREGDLIDRERGERR